MATAAHKLFTLLAGATLLLSVQEETYRVVRVVDGDTIEIEYQGRLEKVRYIGIDTPETVHPRRPVEAYGVEAAEANRQLVEGKRVRLEFDVQRRDRYGRLLAYVYAGDTMVNEWLVREGYAQVATYPPNLKYVDRFIAAQLSAREEGRGMWGLAGDSLSAVDIPGGGSGEIGRPELGSGIRDF